MQPVPVHNHGHVHLEAVLGDELSIVNNARVSFDQASDEVGPKEKGLLNFLMRERHGSPWEAVVFRFDIKAPLFVVREWQRHRMGSFNEQSARYSEIPEHFYIPEPKYIRTQVGKPGSYSFEPIESPRVVNQAIHMIEVQQKGAFQTYNNLMEMGVAKEVARTVLPVGMFSRMKWTVNLRSALNFVSLRNHEHAQREIRDYAEVVEALIEEQLPVVIELFNEHGRVCP